MSVNKRNVFDVVMAYHQDPIVEDLTASIVYLQLAKLQGKLIPKYLWDSTTKEMDVTLAAGNYEERGTILASILLEHIKTYYPELLDDTKNGWVA